MNAPEQLPQQRTEMDYPFLASDRSARLRSFAGVSPSRYQHPADSRALQALRYTAGVEDLVRAYSEHVQERFMRLDNVTQNIRVSQKQLPELHGIFFDCCTRLGVAGDTELYVARDFNAWTSGVERPFVAIGTPLLNIMTVPELRFILGHELGHVLMGHVSYHQVAEWSIKAGTSASLIGAIPLVGGLLKAGLGMALRHWYRQSEFSADRAGLVACQDFESAARALLKVSQFPLGLLSRLNLVSIIEQAHELEELSEDNVSGLIQFANQDGRTHPWTVVRIGELHRWYAEGEYNKLLGEAPILPPASAPSVLRPPLTPFRCPVCSADVPPADRFCSTCGAPVGEKHRMPASSASSAPDSSLTGA